jgi:hypothetical protein
MSVMTADGGIGSSLTYAQLQVVPRKMTKGPLPERDDFCGWLMDRQIRDGVDEGFLQNAMNTFLEMRPPPTPADSQQLRNVVDELQQMSTSRMRQLQPPTDKHSDYVMEFLGALRSSTIGVVALRFGAFTAGRLFNRHRREQDAEHTHP